MQGKQTNLTKVFLAKIYKHGLGPALSAIALFAGLVVLNYVAAVKGPSFDVTRNKVNSLSAETRKLLDELSFNVTVKAFFLSSSQTRIEKLLSQYTKLNSRVKVEFIDPIKNPVVAEKYEVTIPGTLIFETAGKKSRINPNASGRAISEREVTIALYRLMSENTKKIYFTNGHGELNPENVRRDGISSVLERLEEQNYVIEPLNIFEKNSIPADCSVLIIAGPTVPFTEEEKNILMQYVYDGGSVLLMIGPGSKSGLEPLAQSFGIIPGKNYVYETSRSMTTQVGGALAPLCSALDTCEITTALPNQTFLFPFTRSLTSPVSMEKMRFRRLLASSPDSWAESDIESARTANGAVKPSRNDKEERGPVTVAVIVERDVDFPDSVATRTNPTFLSRSAFFGTAGFITNEVVTLFPQNIELFLNTVNWITRNEKIIEIIPHAPVFTPIELRYSERRAITWVTLVLIPFAIIMAGIVVWYRRR